MDEGSRVVGDVPFVGREAERRSIEAALARTRSSAGVAIVLTGAAGIGKTRLADETATGAAGTFDVVWATCGGANAMPPYWPWVQVVGDLLRRHEELRRRVGRDWPSVARMVDAHRRQGVAAPPADRDQARAELYEDVVALVAAAAGMRPHLLVVDDLHNADPSSWLLLAHLAPRLRTLPVAVLATWRTGGARDEGRVAADLFRQVDRIAVPPLGVDQIKSLVDGFAGAAVDASVVEAVHRRTSGNPLLAQEVLAELGAHDDRGRGIAAVAAATVPPTTRLLVGERLGRLGPATRAGLAAAAAIGTRFPLDVCAEVVGTDNDGLLEVLGPAAEAGMLGSIEGGQGTFAHDLIRDAVFESETVVVRARLHRRVGEVLERLADGGRQVEPADLARHFLAAGPDAVDKAVAYALAAGRLAMEMVAYEDAAMWLGRAGEVAGATSFDPANRAELLLALGDALEATGDRLAARASYLEAASIARALARPDLLASGALGLSGTVGFEVALLDAEQIDLLREALGALGSEESSRRASVMARLSVAVSYLENLQARLALTDEALSLARTSGDPAALVQALAARCDALSGPDHIGIRVTLASEIVDVATRLSDRRLQLLGRRLLIVALLEQGDVGGADGQIRAFATTAAALRRPVYSWYVPLWRSMRATMDGSIDAARSALAEAQRAGGGSNSENAAVLTKTMTWYLASELGDTEAIAALLVDSGLEGFPGVWPLVARALCEAQLGRHGTARALLDTVGARLPTAERDSEWLPMVSQVAESVGLVGGHPIASWAYQALLPYRSSFAVEGIAAAVRGPIERDLGLLAAAMGRRRDAADHFDVALAAVERIGAGLLVARTLRDAGVSLEDRSRLDGSRRRYQALGIDRRVAEIDDLLGRHEEAAAAAGGDVFRREGDVWRLVHAGREVRLRDSKGLRDLARLLAAPGRPFPAVELAAAGGRASPAERSPGLHEQGDLGDLIDATARDAYRRRLADLDEEIDDADRAADIERSARATAEKEALVAQLAAAYGIGGRPRKAGDPGERARQAVTARIRDAMARIEGEHPALGRHLHRSVRTGRLCVYEPERPIEWSL